MKKYFIYYKDLSKVFSFSSVTNNFQFEPDIYPQHLIEYNDDLFDVFYNRIIYKENIGNYGEFYGIYRTGEIEYLINPQQSLVCLFNNYAYGMEAITADGSNVVDETWNSLRMYNDYQFSVGKPITCSFDSGTSKINSSSHGLTLNTEIVLSGTIPTGLSLYTVYYLVNVETHYFRLALTKGGTPITFSDSGSCYYSILDAPFILSTFAADGNIQRRFRTWHFKDFRDRSVDKPRMRDAYIRLLFKYNRKERIMEKKCGKAELTNCIKAKAKELWEKDGCKQGNDLAYWLQAEKIVKGQMKK